MLRVGMLLLAIVAQSQSKPLPQLQTFLTELRKSLRTDDSLQNNYTYTEKRTSIELDSQKKPKKTQLNVFEILPGSCERPPFRRQIVKNGARLSAEELAKQERQREMGFKSGGPDGPSKGSPPEKGKAGCGNPADETIMNDLFSLYDIRIMERQIVAGQPTLLVTFKPRENYKPKTPSGEIMKGVAGRAWVSESDYQLARVEAEVIDNVSLGYGANLRKGTKIFSERNKFNNEVWLPARMELQVEAKYLIVKSINLREIVEYSDYKKVASLK